MIRTRPAAIAASLIVAAGAVLSFAAPAAYAATGYHYQSAHACADSGCAGVVFIWLHTTNDSSHVWINGTVGVSTSGRDGLPVVTWHGVGGGNGTTTLDVGANYLTPNAHSQYFRLDIHSAGGSQWCTVSGNAPVVVSGACYA